MSTPKISVIMSAYNAENYLAEALQSLRDQKEENWEGHIVSDGSTDATEDILHRFAKEDSRFKIVKNEKNIGLTKSLNKALASARGMFLARQDADDISLPQRFERQVKYLESHEDVVILGCGYEVIDRNGEWLNTIIPPSNKKAILRQLKWGNVMAHGSLMMRASKLKELGGYREQFRMSQDYDLILRAIRSGTVTTMPDILYVLRLTPQSVGYRTRTLQRFYAKLALQCYVSEQDTSSQEKVIQAALRQLPEEKLTSETVMDRYHFINALYLLKSPYAVRARSELNQCQHPKLKLKIQLLHLFSYLPFWLRSLLLRVPFRLSYFRI